MPVSRLQEDAASQPPPSQPAMPPPPRATLVLPDAITLDDEDQADLSRAGGPHDTSHTSPKAPGAPLSNDKERCASEGQSIENRSAMSSPRSAGGCRDGAPLSLRRQPESRQESGTRCSSPPPSQLRTRTPRVLKTSRDFAHTIRRVYKVRAASVFDFSSWLLGGYCSFRRGIFFAFSTTLPTTCERLPVHLPREMPRDMLARST